MTSLLFMPGQPRRGSFLRPKFQCAIYPPHIFSLRSNKRGPRGRPLASVAGSILAKQDGTRALLGRIGNLTAGQRAPASHPTSTFALPSADPPRRGFRGFVKPRFRNRRSGPVRHPPAHKVRRAPRQFTRNNSRKRESPGNSVDLFAHQRASRGLVAPAAFALHAILLNGPSTVSVAVSSLYLALSRQEEPSLVG